MSDVPIDTLAGAARRYAGLKRRFWRFFFGGVAWLALGFTALAASYPWLNSVAGLPLGLALGLGFLTCCVGALASWTSLLRFRCPRCSKPFVLSCWSSWPTATCKHCELRLG